MCGIAGVYNKRSQVDAAQIAATIDRLGHRGPDSHGTFVSDNVALIHTRLSIIDLGQGGQPLYSDDRRLCLVANGEIYNYIELRQALEQQGYCFKTHSDCEVLLYAYQAYGLSFLDHVLGMFAFALYDQESEQLILARDRLGIKPLFIQQDSRGVSFASEIKALLTLRDDVPSVSAEGLVQYLQNNFTSLDTCIYVGIERLLPAEYVVIKQGDIVKRDIYWQPDLITRNNLSLQDAMREFDALVHDVMNIHVRSDVPFGVFLSGGVDSAVIMAMLKQTTSERVSAYSVGFSDGGVHNEVEDAKRIAKQFDAKHEVLNLSSQELLSALPHSVWAADELMGDYANLPVNLLSRTAAQELKVVFSGEGGDEVFAGYGRYRMNPLRRWVKQLAYPGSGGFRMSKTFSSQWEQLLYQPHLLDVKKSWAMPFMQTWKTADSRLDDMAKMQWVDIKTWLPDDLLVKADRMLMAWGLEGRVPFLDHRIVEFGLSLPSSLKVEGKTGKAFLRHWAEQYLPKDYLWQRKRGFTVPVGQWLQGQRLDELERALLQSAAIQYHFKVTGINALFARQRQHKDVTQLLWRIWQFAIWHRLFIEGNGSMPPQQADPVEFLT